MNQPNLLEREMPLSLAWYGFCLVTRASRALTRCCYRHSWGFNNVTTSRPLLLCHKFTLRVSTEVYGSRTLSSIYILLTLAGRKEAGL